MEQSDECPHTLGHVDRACNKLYYGHTPCMRGITSLNKFEGLELWQCSSSRDHYEITRFKQTTQPPKITLKMEC